MKGRGVMLARPYLPSQAYICIKLIRYQDAFIKREP